MISWQGKGGTRHLVEVGRKLRPANGDGKARLGPADRDGKVRLSQSRQGIATQAIEMSWEGTTTGREGEVHSLARLCKTFFWLPHL